MDKILPKEDSIPPIYSIENFIRASFSIIFWEFAFMMDMP